MCPNGALWSNERLWTLTEWNGLSRVMVAGTEITVTWKQSALNTRMAKQHTSRYCTKKEYRGTDYESPPNPSQNPRHIPPRAVGAGKGIASGMREEYN